MINYYQLSDAMPVALFGMFAPWAAASKLHWFLRTAVVGAALLVALLIPAYEVVLMLALECVLVVAGIQVWRRRRTRTAASGEGDASAEPGSETSPKPRPRIRFQLSMETMMLAMVVVAVATTVIARTPQLSFYDWFRFLHNGAMAAVVCLTCVWLICGQARWWIRLVAAPLLPIILAVVFYTSSVAGYAAYNLATVSFVSTVDYVESTFRNMSGIWYWAKTNAIGMVVLCTWLFLVTRARWFDPFHENRDDLTRRAHSPRAVLTARLGAVALFGLAAIFPVALFYRLMTPPPIPQVTLPTPNGFDDFLAAGRMISSTEAARLGNAPQLTNDQLAVELAKHNAAIDRMRAGLEKQSMHPYATKSWPREDVSAMHHLLQLIRAQAVFFERRGNVQLELENKLDLIKLAHAESRGMASDLYSNMVIGQFEWDGHSGIMKLVPQLPADECIRVAAELWKLDQTREPWSVRLQRRRVIDANAGWKQHVRAILREWSGEERHEWAHIEYLRRTAEMRAVIVELGIHAYKLDNEKLPETLAELVPNYLPGVPDDPYAAGPIRYRIDGNTYKIYFNGPDGDDDGGTPLNTSGNDGDVTVPDLFLRTAQPGTSKSGN